MAGQIIKSKNPKFTFNCPVTKKPITTTPREQMAMPDNKINWWRCPECNGWHVSIAQDEIPLPATTQQCYKPAS